MFVSADPWPTWRSSACNDDYDDCDDDYYDDDLVKG